MEFVRLDHHPVPIGEHIKFHGSKPPTSFYHSTDGNGNIKKPLSIATHRSGPPPGQVTGHRDGVWSEDVHQSKWKPHAIRGMKKAELSDPWRNTGVRRSRPWASYGGFLCLETDPKSSSVRCDFSRKCSYPMDWQSSAKLRQHEERKEALRCVGHNLVGQVTGLPKKEGRVRRMGVPQQKMLVI